MRPSIRTPGSRRATALGALAIAGSALSCDPCPATKCASLPPIHVRVTDGESGDAIAGARVRGTQAGAAVDFSASGGPGSFYGAALGRTDVTVEAYGYASATLTVDVVEDDCGEPIGQERDVGLAKSTSTASPKIVKGPERAACR